MYTYNLFCFGHDLSSDPELNNDLRAYDISFSRKIKNREWEVDFPYHGGQVRGDTYSCVFGITISCDDDNRNFTEEVRSAKESDYLEDYQSFLDSLFVELDQRSDNDDCDDDNNDYKELVEELKNFVIKNKPKFYSVEVSS